MQTFTKYALLFSSLGIAVKIILWQQGFLTDNPEYAGMGYLFFLMFACFFSLYEERRSNAVPTKYIDDFKYGMKSVALFALIVTLFTYGFYEFIDPEYFPNRIAERMAVAEAVDITTVDSPIKLTKEKLMENQRRISEAIYNSTNHSMISLFIFLVLGAAYSAIITWLVRKIS
ncbi:MAG: DUF4199 domain-containing protein [Flavobacteriales bacterium]|nr:DUF4199 domain-containing protein [Flavobacteriales bacterium]